MGVCFWELVCGSQCVGASVWELVFGIYVWEFVFGSWCVGVSV